MTTQEILQLLDEKRVLTAPEQLLGMKFNGNKTD